MRYRVLATDYDGTLAEDGRVTDQSLAALEKLRATGRKLILVTGRELEELLSIFPGDYLFERIVAENGALLYEPGSRAIKVLAERPPPTFIEALRRQNVSPMSVGHAIVATWKPHETAVLETIRDLGLDLQVIFNKDAVMVLPAGVNKATGLAAALKELELSPHEVVGIGDAENDHAFLAMSECAVAVQNALATVKERADLVTPADHGRGVEQVIGYLLENDLRIVEERLLRHTLLLGTTVTGEEVRMAPHGDNLLIAGPSGSGKSTIAKSILERLQEHHYQYCIIDPEGDYDGLEGAVTIGNSKRPPAVEEILQLVKNPEANVVINLLGLPLADRPPFFVGPVAALAGVTRTDRPAILDRCGRNASSSAVRLGAGPCSLTPTIAGHDISDCPSRADSARRAEGNYRRLGRWRAPEKTIKDYCQPIHESSPHDFSKVSFPVAEAGQAVLWQANKGASPLGVRVTPPVKEHQRHIRKYAEGDLSPERCFYFRGPDGKLNLRVRNLVAFNQIAAGVDDATWLYHLKQGDYSRWFREHIHDEALANEIAAIEHSPKPSAAATRERIKELIEGHYTLPVSAPLPLAGTDAESKQ